MNSGSKCGTNSSSGQPAQFQKTFALTSSKLGFDLSKGDDAKYSFNLPNSLLEKSLDNVVKIDLYSCTEAKPNTGALKFSNFFNTAIHSNDNNVYVLDDDTNKYWVCSYTFVKTSQNGGKKKYKGHSYSVKTGQRGGKYILVQGKKVYV